MSGALDSGLRVALEIDADHDPGTGGTGGTGGSGGSGGTGGTGGMPVTEDFDIIEDSCVRQNNANNNYGSSSNLSIRDHATVALDSYLKVLVSGVGTVTNCNPEGLLERD
jgi:hypothetical protein